MAKIADSSTPSRHSEASIAARMDRFPITPLHRRAVVVIGLGQFFDLYEIFLAGVLSSVLASQFKLDKGVGRAAAGVGVHRDVRRRHRARPASPTGWAGGARSCSASASIRCSRCSPRSARARRCWWSRRFLAGLGHRRRAADRRLLPRRPAAAGNARPLHRAGPTRSAFLGVPASGFLGPRPGADRPAGHRRLALDVRDRRARRVVVVAAAPGCRSRRAGWPRTAGARRPTQVVRRFEAEVAQAEPARARPRARRAAARPRRRSASCWCRRSASARG